MTRASGIIATLALTLVLGLGFAATQWQMQPKDSKLTFVGTQADAQFEGVFERFTADIQFDPKDLGSSRFDVQIELASVNSGDDERDDIIKGVDLFDVQRFPKGRYVAGKFTHLSVDKFSAMGKLTLRDITRDVPIEFTFQNRNGSAWLKGSATLKRLDFGVGRGEWQDTQAVANEVKIRFTLLLK